MLYFRHSCKPHCCCAQENGIGLDHALFYVAHAAYLELRGSYRRAEAVFQSGLDRCAAGSVLARSLAAMRNCPHRPHMHARQAFVCIFL